MADGVDQGGMNYKITVEDQGSAEVAKFRQELRTARTELKAFKDELAGRSKSASTATRQLDALAKAGVRSVRAAKQSAAAERDAAVKHNQRSQAILDANKAFDKKVRLDNAATVSSNRNFAAERRMATAVRQRAQAEAAITKILERRQQSALREQAALARNIALTDQERRALGLLNAEQRRVLAANERLAAQQQNANPNVSRINAETEALRRQNRARLENETEQLLAARGLDKDGNAIERPQQTGIQQRIKDFLGLGKSIDGAENRANRAAFTFRRLFGILAAFAAARALGNLFSTAIREGIEFNAVMERSRLGIAGILAAAGEIRDRFGNTTDAATRLSIALGIASDQIEKLKTDALATTATFEDLVESFQTGLAPGLQAGFDVDQIRIFTRQISLAASAIGLEQRQLAEEIRSILTGTINPRNTRIATALGISNEDIRNAKEAGTLFEFLQKRFEAFDVAGKQAAQTLPGLFERLKDAVQQVLGAGFKDLSNDLKGLMTTVIDLIVQVDETTGKIQLNPEIVRIVDLMAEGLRTVVEEAQRIGEAVGIQGFQTLADGIGTTIRFIARVLGGIIEGAIQGVRFVFSILLDIRNLIQNIAGIDILDPEVLRKVMVVVSAIAAATLTITLLLSAASPLLKIIGVAFSGIRLTVFAISGIVRGLVASLTAIRTASVAIGLSASPLLGIFVALAAAIGAVAFAYGSLTKKLDIANTTQTNFWARQIAQMEIFTRRLFEENRIKDSRGFFVVDPKDAAETQRQFRDMEAFFDNEAKSEKDLTATVKDKITEIFGDMKKLVGDSAKEAEELEKKMKFDGFLLANSEAIQELRDRFQELKEQARESSDAATSAIKAIGLQSDVGRIITTAEGARLEAARESRRLDLERAQIENQRAAVIEEINSLQVRGGEEFEQLVAKQVALTGRLIEIDRARLQLAEAILRVKTGEMLETAAQAAFQLREENALTRIEAANARILRIAELTGDLRQLALTTAQQELAIAEEKGRQEDATAQRSIAAINREIQANRDRVALLEQSDPRERSVDDQLALTNARALTDALTEQRDALQDQANLQATIRQEEIARLQNIRDMTALQQQAPIGTGIVQAFADQFRQVSDAFKVTVDLMSQAIQGFSQFAASSIVDAFDPTNDTSILENFARFLQQLATMIISTLIQLAVTAAALNLASGGLLGPLLQKYARAQGFHEGGPAEGRHEGGRALRSHRRARGYFDGGSPTARGVHGVDRPSTGLHPADTIPIWAAADEWVVRGSSVKKAGTDALDRINRGLFDPFELRSALGLRSFHNVTRTSRRGKGFVDGGATNTARNIISAQAGTTRGSLGSNTAVLTVDQNTSDQITRGGENATLRLLAKHGIMPRRR